MQARVYVISSYLLLVMGVVSVQKNHKCQRHQGYVYCENKSVEQLQTSGLIKLDNMQVNGLAQLRGKVDIHNSELTKLLAYGQLTMTKVTIREQMQIFGQLNARESTWHNTLIVWSNTMSLTASYVYADVIMHGEQNAKCSIKLSDHTKVMGDVVFKDCEGVVELHASACVVGAVVNGEIINKP